MSGWRDRARRILIFTGEHRRSLRRRMAGRGNRLVLVLHRVLPGERGNDHSPPGMVVSTESFERLLDFLGNEFELPGVTQFLDGHPAPREKPSALVTFDDGWLDSAENGGAALHRRGIPGVLFASVDHVERGELFWPERLLILLPAVDSGEFRRVTGEGRPDPADAGGVEALLTRWKGRSREEREEWIRRLSPGAGGAPEERRIATWEELRVLRSRGIEIGSHGMSHRLLTRLPGEEALAELRLSRERIGEALGETPRLFAYPNGDRNEAVRAAAREAGYDFAFSLRGDPRDPYDLPRVNLHEGKMAEGGGWSPDRLVLALAAG
ncbi:MAG: polysaccharide deacetylase family protein [Candidatus Eisenbacteria bacterium]